MIVTDLEHAAEQIPMTPSMRQALDFLRQAQSKTQPDGRVEIDGSKVFALFQSYESIAWSAAKFEAHRKYIDVQYIASGVEVIGWAPLERMTITEAYNDTKDVLFGTIPPGEMTPVQLKAGLFAVLYPTDAHAPKIAVGAPAAVKKIVLKVAV
jgi:biofilm protein TabA